MKDNQTSLSDIVANSKIKTSCIHCGKAFFVNKPNPGEKWTYCCKYCKAKL